jgi:lysine/ornithine N-monooxygenase
MVIFMDGKSESFDAIIFATGYKSTANKWLEVQMIFWIDTLQIL